MFERFDDQARRTVVAAQEIAAALHINYIDIEMLYIAVLEHDDVRAVLLDNGLSVEDYHALVANSKTLLSPEDPLPAPVGHRPFTMHAKRALERSLRFALTIGANKIGSPQLLGGILDVAMSEQIPLTNPHILNYNQYKEFTFPNVGDPLPTAAHPATRNRRVEVLIARLEETLVELKAALAEQG